MKSRKNGIGDLYKTETRQRREQMYGHQRRKGRVGGMSWETGIDMYTLLCTK